ncbi:MAG: phage tail sheath subtilisin-like domain-containing protein [Proteobacteria bacterium]|nr:phage tail sheath subtilisin-like domain-containing protein [Pseudomonadota bacterium]
MPFSVSPSVRIVEKDLSAIIPSASNTTAAFVGRFDWGPYDTVVNISSEKELHSVFGPPNPSERGVDWFCAANFLNYGDKLKVVRVDESRPSMSYWQMVSGTNAHIGATASYVLSGATSARLEARSAGQKGNALRIITWNNGQPEPKHPNGSKVFTYAPTSTQSVYESYLSGVLSEGTNLQGSTLDECHIAVIDTLGYYGASGDVLESFQGLSRWKGVADASGKSLYYKDVINNKSNYFKIEDNPNRSIWHAGTTGDPLWTSQTTGPIREHGRGAAGDTEGVFQSFLGRGTDYAETPSWRFGGGAGSGVTWPYEGVGNDDTIPQGYTYNPQPYSIMEAWNKHFKNPEFEDVDLLIAGAAEQLVSRHLIELAEYRKDCVAFISPPSSPAGTEYNDIVFDGSLGGYSGPTSIVNYRNNTLNASSSYAVMDSGYKYMYDSYNDRYRWVPLNPDVAGLVVRTESQQDPWFSPAGFNRGKIQGVVKLSINPSKAERDELYGAGINPVVTFPGEGTLLFGDKTLQRRATALDRINVRRLMIHLEKAIATAAKYQLFEFNDAFTRRSFINMVNPFLRRVESQRGLTDFRVVCDDTNNTSQVIDNNEFVADIFIKPSKSINYIQLNFTVLRSDAIFEETVS